MTSQGRRKLVEFLERKAFDPVLRADPDRYSDNERRKLEHAQRATQAEVDRFRNYASAEEVVTNFERDLTSDAAQKVHRELESLGLPTIGQYRDAFLKLAQDVGAR